MNNTESGMRVAPTAVVLMKASNSTVLSVRYTTKIEIFFGFLNRVGEQLRFCSKTMTNTNKTTASNRPA